MIIIARIITQYFFIKKFMYLLFYDKYFYSNITAIKILIYIHHFFNL